jgi:hypothetical protein
MTIYRAMPALDQVNRRAPPCGVHARSADEKPLDVIVCVVIHRGIHQCLQGGSMLRPLTVSIVLALVWSAAPAAAQDCSKIPFQASGQVDVAAGASNRGHGTVALPVSGLTEIEHISVRFNNRDAAIVTIYDSQVTTQLNGVSVKHGIDVASNTVAVPFLEGDLSRQVHYYTDDSSQVVFDIDVVFGVSNPMAGQMIAISSVGR